MFESETVSWTFFGSEIEVGVGGMPSPCSPSGCASVSSTFSDTFRTLINIYDGAICTDS